MLKSHRLPLQFDAAALARDLARLRPEDWTPHFNVHHHDGGWSGVALRAPGGDAAKLYPDPDAAEPYADTPFLARCPAVAAALAVLRCPYTSVRLLRLRAGSRIREHRDYDLAFCDGEVRLHVPVVTHPDVEFVVDGERVELAAGECWYLDFNRPHRVDNRSAVDRVHLVVDCVVDEWLAAQFPPALRAASLEGREELERFRRLVLDDAALEAALRDPRERERFLPRLVRAGRERGHRFGASEVLEALRDARRGWLERWL
ncbi:MAG TPA: aspartyl/asparaginyl beta-hydroxylase domain-containing protein [Myxococcota bacterium]|jgi:hypothetical protein|nr:aspartyl/asparaginyl beta-hydroxylase domain-containing protein [Myxococcota bacterium]